MGHERLSEKDMARFGIDQRSGVRRGGRGQVDADQQLPWIDGRARRKHDGAALLLVARQRKCAPLGLARDRHRTVPQGRIHPQFRPALLRLRHRRRGRTLPRRRPSAAQRAAQVQRRLRHGAQ